MTEASVLTEHCKKAVTKMLDPTMTVIVTKQNNWFRKPSMESVAIYTSIKKTDYSLSL